MMHYGSWLHQGVLDNRYYNRYEELYQNREQRPEDDEPTGDETQETATSATSCERSTSADIFRLEFAAAQWSKLVSNAEGLFNKLMINNVLPDTEQDQIEQWLCLKQEYEECIASDETAGFQETARRSLERIEEVTETEEKTDESGASRKLRKSSSSDDEELEDCESSSENPDFLEKLDELMSRFKSDTDRMIEAKRCEFLERVPRTMNNDDYVPIVKPIPIRNQNSRRNSMLPGSEMCNEVITFNGNFKPCRSKKDEISVEERLEVPELKEESPVVNALQITEPMKTLKSLTEKSEAKQSMVKKIQSDLEIAQRRIVELQSTIRIKERFIEDMNKNSEVRSCAREKFQRKRNRLEEEYYKTRSQLAQAENACMRTLCEGTEKGDSVRKEVQRYKNLAIHYEKRLMDIEMIKQIAGDSAKKVLELEASLNTSRKQMEKLKKQLKREEERKKQLEREVSEDQRRIKDLEEKYNLTASKLREMEEEEELREVESEEEKMLRLEGKFEREEKSKEAESEEDKFKEISSDEGKSPCNGRFSFEKRFLSEEKNFSCEEVKSPCDEKKFHCEEKFSYESPCEDRCEEKKSLLEVSARISHIDQVLKEKSMNLERMTDTDSKEALRHEIRNLRRTRECLIEEKCGLDEKLQKERTLSTLEERKLLECGETIEAIDAMIEHKNEMICGRRDFSFPEEKREKSESMLSQLEKLSDGEMRTLFNKYFWKVIDLKQSSKNLEIQAAELERHIEAQDKHVRNLSEALQRTKIEAERKLVEMQRDQQERLHLIFRHIAEETGGSSGQEIDRNVEIAKLKRENKVLKRRLSDVEALLKNPANGARNVASPRIVQQELKKIGPKTKVTRERNKLIIQQTMDSDKRKK